MAKLQNRSAARKSVKISDKDMGYESLMTLFDLGGEYRAKIGFLSSSGIHKGTDLTVAQVAAIHEFGSSDGTIPERSFMRTAMDTNSRAINKMIEKLAGKVIDRTMKQKQAVGLVAQTCVDYIKHQILTGRFKPLKPATVKAKGSSKPLIDTKQMLNSVSFEIEQVKGKKTKMKEPE